ncbi:MAG: hypothetical protein HRU12_20760 [Phaeodactylibacter sp.]|nr:hypothetical protein [Phaeodactylibacter sp.]
MKKLLALACFVSCCTILKGQGIRNLTTEAWSEDIDFLQDRLFQTLPEAGSRIDTELFQQKVSKLKEDLPSLSAAEVVLELQSLLAMAKDNGCYIYPFQPKIDFPLLPLKTYWFSDGLFVCDAAEPYHHLIGSKIEKINETGIDELFGRLKEVLPADNESYQRYMFPMYMQIQDWLMRAGISGEITLATSKGEEKIAFQPVTSYIPLKRELASYRKLSGSNQDHKSENFWMEFLPEEKILFIQFLQINDQGKGSSFKSFVSKVAKTLESKKVERLVIDNRYGGGGNGFKLKPFTDLIQQSKTVNQKGKLFVLTSRATRGTVLELTSILQLNTNAIIVGEPTGEGPNLVGDTKEIELPNSKIALSLTHIFWPTSFKSDTRNTIYPDKEVAYSYSAYKAGTDPWLDLVNREDAVLSTGPPSSALMASLSGKHKIDGRTLEIYEEDGRLFMKVDRKIKSFFELKTELFSSKEGLLDTGIEGVTVSYATGNSSKTSILSIDWYGETLE